VSIASDLTSHLDLGQGSLFGLATRLSQSHGTNNTVGEVEGVALSRGEPMMAESGWTSVAHGEAGKGEVGAYCGDTLTGYSIWVSMPCNIEDSGCSCIGTSNTSRVDKVGILVRLVTTLFP
jgi:hypothetical protein